MKTKNSVIAIAAFAVAILGTFTSYSYMAVEDLFVKVRLQGQASVTCQDTHATCNVTGGSTSCTVIIDLNGTPTTVPAYRSGCITLAKTTGAFSPIDADFDASNDTVIQYNP